LKKCSILNHITPEFPTKYENETVINLLRILNTVLTCYCVKKYFDNTDYVSINSILPLAVAKFDNWEI